MASKSIILINACCLTVFVLAGSIHGKTFANPLNQQRQYGCIGTIAMCAMPVMMLDAEGIERQIKTQGFTGICGTLSAVSNCVQMARAECGEDEELPPEFSQSINLLTESVNFVCVQELANINADRECMLSKALNDAVKRNCGAAQPSGEVCNLSEDLECGLTQYERICNNRSLANKFRAFAAKLERDSNCRRRKALSMTWRQLINMLRR